MNLKEKKEYVKRLATESEVIKFYECIIDEQWEDVLKNENNIFFKDDFKKGYDVFKEELIYDYKESIGDFIIAEDFPEVNCAIYTAVKTSTDNDNTILSIPYRIERIEEKYFKLEEDAIVFDFSLEILTKKTISMSKNQVGRPSCPTEDSIRKTLAIKSALLTEQKLNVNDACSIMELAKSTYYSTLKWINKHPIN